MRNRNAILLALFAATPLVAGCGVHLAAGKSLLPYQGRSLHKSDEFRIGLNVYRLPNWAFDYAFNQPTFPLDSATFLESKCFTGTPAETRTGRAAGCHPKIAGRSDAFEMQYRWQPTRTVHPLASLAIGRMSTEYRYWSGGRTHGRDSTSATSFVMVGAGGELNLTSWLHLTVIGGYRGAFRKTLPDATVSNSGLTFTTLVRVGIP